MDYLGWILFGVAIGVTIGALVTKWLATRTNSTKSSEVSELLKNHFHPLPMNDITISQRQFPFRVRADGMLFKSGTLNLKLLGAKAE